MDYNRIKSVEVLNNTNFATKKDNPFTIKITFTDNTVIDKVCGKKQAQSEIKKYKKECPKETIFNTEALK